MNKPIKQFTLKLAKLEEALSALWPEPGKEVGPYTPEGEPMFDCVVLSEEGHFGYADEEGCQIATEEEGFQYLVVARRSEGIRKAEDKGAVWWATWLLNLYAERKGDPANDPFREYGDAEVLLDDGKQVKELARLIL